MSSIKDYMQDLVKNVISTNFFDKIKIAADAKGVIIEALEKEKEVVLKGKFLNPLAELKGEFGLSNLSLLGHITGDSEFNNDQSKIDLIYDAAAPDTPSEMLYENKSKSYINYRFMNSKLLPKQPTFVEPAWDVVIKPSKTSIQQFNWAAAGLSAYEQYFVPKVENGDMKFFIGDANSANQRGGVVFASGLTATFNSQHKWKISHIQSVLKLADSSDCEIAFSLKGAIQVKVNTGVGEYKFILPAKVN
jgi:hypothetical protein